MLTLNLPSYTPKVVVKNGKYFIFDPIRLKNVVLTPEEWVRQHFINYLITQKEFPKELIANEVAVSLNSLSKRCDSVVYDCYLNPLAIIEYKAPSVLITQEVFEQIARYNIALRVKYLIVSNGMDHFCCEIDYEKQVYHYLKEVPSYNRLANTTNSSDEPLCI